jgi:hypothetical protein
MKVRVKVDAEKEQRPSLKGHSAGHKHPAGQRASGSNKRARGDPPAVARDRHGTAAKMAERTTQGKMEVPGDIRNDTGRMCCSNFSLEVVGTERGLEDRSGRTAGIPGTRSVKFLKKADIIE